MNAETPVELQARVAQLEAENRALREQVGARDTAQAVPPAPAQARRPSRGRSVLAAVLVTLGVLLTPVSVIAGWAKTTLTDTEAFTSTYAPLGRSPEIQQYVIDQTVAAIDDHLDIDALTADLVAGIQELGAGPRASAALEALQGPAALGLRTLVRNAVTAFVTSDLFAEVWAQALRVSHTQVVATLEGDPDAVVTVTGDSTIGVQLGPIVARVRDVLVEQGIGIASRIPDVDRTIVVAQSDSVPTIQLAYGLVETLGTWLPWFVLALLVAGVLAARHRSRALSVTGVAFAGALLVMLLVLGAGRLAVQAFIVPGALPVDVTTLLFDTATDPMRQTGVAGVVLGLAVAVIAWLAGPGTAPTRLRAAYADGLDGVAASSRRHGLTTGRTGVWVGARLSLLVAATALVAAVVIVLARPVTLGLVVGTVAVSLLVVVALTVVAALGTSTTAAVAAEDG